MESRGFIAVEALVGVMISISSCLILVMSFRNMNDFAKRQQDELNAHLTFIKTRDTKFQSLIIDDQRYQVLKNNKVFVVKNLDKGTTFKIEKK